jgi:hypothetical protein
MIVASADWSQTSLADNLKVFAQWGNWSEKVLTNVYQYDILNQDKEINEPRISTERWATNPNPKNRGYQNEDYQKPDD